MPDPVRTPVFTVAQLVEAARLRGDDGVTLAVGPWVLVGSAPTEEERLEWSFRTLSARTVRVTLNDVETVLKESALVFPLQKSRKPPFADTLLVGRASNNDVVLHHPSVSKLHARIRVAEDGTRLISDANSANGTEVDGTFLDRAQELPLKHGTVLRLGTLPVQVFETQGFVALLKRFP